ncbi:MAG TPA: PTS sugar transporter subunit IIA [Acidobacteria bacterium]|nr:PTS sugar transporter subunit IIA [Acidobacteriota bacterium]
MKLQQLIQPNRVVLGLEASDAEEAIAVVGELISEELGVPAQKVAAALMEREKLGSTGVGDGFAIPHCKLPGISEIIVAVIRFNEGVEFHSPDGKPVRLMFVVISPPDQPAAHLQVLSQIARVLKRKDVRRKLLEAEDAAAIVALIQESAEAEGL